MKTQSILRKKGEEHIQKPTLLKRDQGSKKERGQEKVEGGKWKAGGDGIQGE